MTDEGKEILNKVRFLLGVNTIKTRRKLIVPEKQSSETTRNLQLLL